MRNRATFKCLDTRGDSVYAKSCVRGNNNQVWLVVYVDANHFVLSNLATARCLDSNGAGKVYTLPCNIRNHHQQWKAVDAHHLTFANRATNRLLDSNWHQSGHPDKDLGEVYTLPRNFGEHQNWNVIKP
ncbi:RICIN domain-containing protein [Micromonospora sp. NPDC002389]|uniref:RICIN domain-containing protein n=1 Tax=Micromonospora sp. NPDC002389 TaxID=3154272 RepID=UPI003319A5BA